jgi:phosphoenolpyruvate---glycerone phosphotransferase subunit DhaL
MPNSINYETLAAMLQAVADKIKSNHELLSKLDSATGDGDHGTTMLRVAEAIGATLEQEESKDLKTLLDKLAWAVMSTDGGSTSPLFGSFFMGMSAGLGDDNILDCAAIAKMLESGAQNLQKNTRAKLGDKTLIDALIPAVEAIGSSAKAGKNIEETLQEGMQAAAKGAESTKDMQAAFGRARNLGERTLGHVDPGATSMSLVFAGLMEGYKNG